MNRVHDVRKQEEIAFHNRRELDRREMKRGEFENRYANKKWYAVTRESEQYVTDWMTRNCAGKIALDYCCGLGGISIRLAEAGAYVVGIDISDESVRTSRARLADAGYGSRSEAHVMDAEKLTFPDKAFDVIVCSGVLHHLDLRFALPQLARVLKPSGRILCIEAVGHNPLFRLYRKVTPQLRTSWEVDHILKMKDLRAAKEYFGAVDVRFFHLASVAAVFLRRSVLFGPALSVLEAADRVLLSIPGVRTMAWQMVFELSKPKVDGETNRQAA